MEDREPAMVGRVGEAVAFDDPSPLGTSVRVTLDLASVRAIARVDLRERFEIAAFFDDLAASWDGWSGPREWQSEDLDMTLTCWHDGRRAVLVYVELRDHFFDSPVPRPAWTASGLVSVEPGALESIAVALRRLMSG